MGCSRGALFPDFTTLYIAPTEDQASKFSRDRIGPIIKNSPIIANEIDDANSVYVKSFREGGRYYIRYAKYNPDNIRGVTCDAVHYDEIQDQNLDVLAPVIDEAMFTSEYQFRLWTGTPKSYSHPTELLWQKSDQREWVIRCQHHTPNKWVNIGPKNIGLKGPVCHHCGHLLDVDDGVWVKHQPTKNIAGFHVHQLHCKISHDTERHWSEMLIKFEEYPEDKLMNEVFGISADTAEVPITKELIQGLCDTRITIDASPRAEYLASPNFAGIDWGHGEAATTLSIGHFHEGRFRYVFLKKYEGSQTHEDYCIPDMIKIMRAFHVVRVHADYGGGHGLNSTLAKGFGRDKVTTNLWSGTVVAANERWQTKHDQVARLTLNKSNAFAEYIKALNKKQMIFPKWSQMFPDLVMDLCNVRKDLDNKERVVFIKHGNDDLLQSSIYAWVIARLHHQSDLL
jgi:hypothetical protein